MTNRSLWAIGNNNLFGQFGNNETSSDVKSSPVSVFGDITDWSKVSASSTHTVGLRDNGSIWCWGNNEYGAIGDSTTISRSSPVSISTNFENWVHITASDHVSGGVMDSGSLWVWGRCPRGILGEESYTTRSSPVSVITGINNWVKVVISGYSVLALRGTEDTIWTWGANDYGQLGDYSIVDRSSPVSVVGGFTDWDFIDASGNSMMGIRGDGSLWAWGRNVYGTLGDDTTESRSSPVSVLGGFTDWVDVSIASDYVTGIRGLEDISIWAWGYNTSEAPRSSPLSIQSPEINDWVSISSGADVFSGITSSGKWYINGTEEVESGYSDWVAISGNFGIRGSALVPPSVDRYPLVLDAPRKIIREIPSRDNLALTGCSIINANQINGIEVSSFSDMDLKYEIKTISNALETVKALRGVSFEWNDLMHGSHKKNLGLIAQEVEEVVPEVVCHNNNGLLSVSYETLVALLIEAIKEQEILLCELEGGLKNE